MNRDEFAAAVQADYVEALEADRDRCRAALVELITLKDGPRDDEYRRRKSLAWQAARDAVGRIA